MATLGKLVLAESHFLIAAAMLGMLGAATSLRTRGRARQAAPAFCGETATTDGRLPALLSGTLVLTTLIAAVVFADQVWH